MNTRNLFSNLIPM